MTQRNFDRKVSIVYSFLPHYRYGVFKELERKIDDLTFISGLSSKDGSIATIPVGTFKEERLVDNIWGKKFLWQKGLAREIMKANPEMVIFMGDAAYLSTWIQAIVARLRGRKVYFWTIGWHRPDSGIRRLVRLIFYRLANGLLIYGNHGRKLGIEAGYPADRMEVIYNSWSSSTDVESVELDEKNLPDGKKPVIGAVIRLSPNKGLPEIVRAIAHLRDDFGIEADGLIIGEGPEREELEALASELNVSLYLPGAIYSHDQLKMIYEKLDVTVVPKAAGLTVIQSMTEGTPVITVSDPNAQMPEFEAIEDGETGSLIPIADGESIAAACAFWIEKTQRSKAEISERCRLMIDEYWSPESQATRIISFLEKVKMKDSK